MQALAWLKRLKWWDIFFYGIIIYLLVGRAPAWVDSWRQQGEVAQSASINDLEGAPFAFPPSGTNSIVVFWATWCGPCKIELDRLKEASDEGKIDPQKVFAISIGEEAEVVRKAVEERGYPFKSLLDHAGALANEFKVVATPTIVFLESTGEIDWVTSGLSPTLVLRAEGHIPR